MQESNLKRYKIQSYNGWTQFQIWAPPSVQVKAVFLVARRRISAAIKQDTLTFLTPPSNWPLSTQFGSQD